MIRSPGLRSVGIAAALLTLAFGGVATASPHAGTPASVTDIVDPPSSTALPPVPAVSGADGTDTTVTFTVDGLPRDYILFVPNNLPPGPRPLVLYLHYFSANGAISEAKTGFDAVAARHGALVAYPDGVGASWNGGGCCGAAMTTDLNDVGFLDAVLDDVEARYSIDTQQVAMGGFSNGGVMSYRYACERSTRVHAFFVGSGVPMAPHCSFTRPVAILHMHGLQDSTVPWRGTKTSPLAKNGVIPPVPTAVSGVAHLDGCNGWSRTKLSKLITRYRATKCPRGAVITLLTSSDMNHHWSNGARDRNLYGFDETSQTWAFILGIWATS